MARISLCLIESESSGHGYYNNSEDHVGDTLERQMFKVVRGVSTKIHQDSNSALPCIHCVDLSKLLTQTECQSLLLSNGDKKGYYGIRNYIFSILLALTKC